MKRTRLTPLVVAIAAVAIGSVLTALVVISSASQQSTAVSLSAQSRAKGSSLGGSVAKCFFVLLMAGTVVWLAFSVGTLLLTGSKLPQQILRRR